MCILLSSTLHPDYPLILLSNRDEYFARATQLATLRPINGGGQILSPLDLARPERGTWIGITNKGKLAVLVNYREQTHVISEVSRGVLPCQYLTNNLNDEEWYENLELLLSRNSPHSERVTLEQIGGFTLVYGQLKLDANQNLCPLNLMSNRGKRSKVHSPAVGNTRKHVDMAEAFTFGLSNSVFDQPWPKVNFGTRLLTQLLADSVESCLNHEQLVAACFRLLSTDTFDPEIRQSKDFDSKLKEVMNSIFIPPLETHYSPEERTPIGGKYYGTRTQVVIMFHKSGTLHYHERDLHREDTEETKIEYQHYTFDLHNH